MRMGVVAVASRADVMVRLCLFALRLVGGDRHDGLMTMEPGSPGEQSVAAGVAALDVVPEAGLSRAVAAERLERFGPNELEARARESVLGMVVGAVTEPFVLLLMVA